ncbi:hypothetical protein INR49_023545 [Caranx melampygus]|nr:hypothetical protein INR49_023545 [Caranx melampygus]
MSTCHLSPPHFSQALIWTQPQKKTHSAQQRPHLKPPQRLPPPPPLSRPGSPSGPGFPDDSHPGDADRENDRPQQPTTTQQLCKRATTRWALQDQVETLRSVRTAAMTLVEA